MELKGKLESKLKAETGTSKAGKEWTKQTIVINNGSEYNPQTAISFFGDDKVKMLDLLILCGGGRYSTLPCAKPSRFAIPLLSSASAHAPTVHG